MKKILTPTMFLSFLVILAACAQFAAPPSADPSRSVSNAEFEASLSPVLETAASECMAFHLKVSNKTDRPIFILWDKTLYFNEDKALGNFMYKGVEYPDRFKQRTPEAINPRASLSREIWPCTLAYYTGPTMGWKRFPMPPGRNRVHLTVGTGESEIVEAMEVVLPALE